MDAGIDPVVVTLSATNGTLTLSRTSGLTFLAGDGTDDATMTFFGTVADINPALNGLTFKPTAGFYGAAGLQITTDDQGHNGSGGALNDTDSVAITVNPGGTLQFSSATYQSGETGIVATITVTRTNGSSGTPQPTTPPQTARRREVRAAGQALITWAQRARFLGLTARQTPKPLVSRSATTTY